jgi:hypothetical protein
MCQDPGSNRGPIPLQGSALPTELSWRMRNNIRILHILILSERYQETDVSWYLHNAFA